MKESKAIDHSMNTSNETTEGKINRRIKVAWLPTVNA